MILSCNSCEKKFVVPDNAISANGRLVQCSSCGNKWKQYPFSQEKKPKDKPVKIKTFSKKSEDVTRAPKRKRKRKTGPSLYSPEYLAKKHGIKIDESIGDKNIVSKKSVKVNFGFYSSLIIFLVLSVSFLRLLYFSQDIIVAQFPISERYLNYLFENIVNIKEITQNFFSSY